MSTLATKTAKEDANYNVTIRHGDGSQVDTFTYKLRSLSEREIPSWAQFCQSCFQHKQNPPSAEYFARHYYNDPSRDFTLIRVMFTVAPTTETLDIPTGVIASSLRIFKRQISTGGIGAPLNSGGIGEVGTSPSHRKRGLAKILLQDAFRIMSEPEQKIECSLLHARPEFVPVYQKSGSYVCVISHWSVITIHSDRLFSSVDGNQSTNKLNRIEMNVRLAQFPADTQTLQRIHKVYSEDRFAGCIIRSEEYWNEYISREIGKSLFVLTIPNVDAKQDENATIIGWIAVRTHNGQYQLQDFGVDKEISARNGFTVPFIMAKLLKISMEQQLALKESQVSGEIIKLRLPNPILKELQAEDSMGDSDWIDWDSNIVSEDDTGWMYKTFSNIRSDLRDMVYLVQKQKKDHIIWPSDSF